MGHHLMCIKNPASQLSSQRRPRRAARFARGAARASRSAITWRKTRLEIALIGHLPELYWLVVDLPLWKIMEWKSVGMMKFPMNMESHKIPWFQSPPSSLAFTRLLLIPSSMGKTKVEHVGSLPPKEIDQFVNPSSREDLKLNLPLVLSSQFLQTFPAPLPGRKPLPNHPKSLQSPTLWSLAISNFGTKNIYTVAD